jgi:hypothetical protein
LRQVEEGTAVGEICRKAGISEAKEVLLDKAMLQDVIRRKF